jgi:hypothetical protein
MPGGPVLLGETPRGVGRCLDAARAVCGCDRPGPLLVRLRVSAANTLILLGPPMMTGLLPRACDRSSPSCYVDSGS